MCSHHRNEHAEKTCPITQPIAAKELLSVLLDLGIGLDKNKHFTITLSVRVANKSS